MSLYTLVTIGWAVVFSIGAVVYLWPKKPLKIEE
jgi:hypothetical protein